MNSGSSAAADELTPTALYEAFVQACKKKLHLLISYDGGKRDELDLLISNDCLTKNAFHLVVPRWPTDALRKSAELILEDVNLDRTIKKTAIEKGIEVFEELRCFDINIPFIKASSIFFL